MPSVIQIAAAALLCASQVFALPAEDILEKRDACNQDNVLRAMQNRLPDSFDFCSTYASLPATATITSYASTVTITRTIVTSTYTAHPVALFNLQRPKNGKPITYASPPSPSTIPGGGCDYPSGGYCSAVKATNKRALEGRQTSATTTTVAQTVPSYLATVPASRISSGCSCLGVPYSSTVTSAATGTTTVTITTASCTTTSKLAEATFANICAPRNQVNAPSFTPPNPSSGFNVVTAKAFNALTKLDCCNACVNVFNCVWWKFDFGTPNADGSGNGWDRGVCTYGYNVGIGSAGDNPLAICPNGLYFAFSGISPSGLNGANNLPGYNPGPCGGGYGQYQSSYDGGDSDVYGNQCKK